MVGFGKWKSKPDLGLTGSSLMKPMFYLVGFSESLIFIQPLSYSIIDPDFQETTSLVRKYIVFPNGNDGSEVYMIALNYDYYDFPLTNRRL